MMKKIISAFLIFMLLGTTVYAKTGDVRGSIYATDITASINGVSVPSYNIGGKTAVIIEDITTNYTYNDEVRTLLISELVPSLLISGSNPQTKPTGTKVGNIYETDIKTYFRGVELPCYALDGKMAVAIEDLGGDRQFSQTGSRYFWWPEERKIELESIYFGSSISSMLQEKHINMTIDENNNATFEAIPLSHGAISGLKAPSDSIPQPIYASGTIIGYVYQPKNCVNFYKETDDSKTQLVISDEGLVYTYFYEYKVAEIIANIPAVQPTKEEVIQHFITQHSVGEPVARFDTDNYSFVYLSTAGTSWTSYVLLQAFNDGTYINYAEQIDAPNRSPQDLVIDEENEKVTFKHVDRYHSEWFTKYEIDLKTAEIKAVE